MKKLLLGIALILYCIFLTPTFLEPSDLVVSTGYITLVNTYLPSNIAPAITFLWMMSGYLALIIGIVLVGISAHKYLGGTASIILKNPFAFLITAVMLSLIITVIVMNVFRG